MNKKKCIVSLIFLGNNLLFLSITFFWSQLKLWYASQKCIFMTVCDCNWTRTHNHLVHKWKLNQTGQMIELCWEYLPVLRICIEYLSVLQTYCLSVFDYFVGLALKVLSNNQGLFVKYQISLMLISFKITQILGNVGIDLLSKTNINFSAFVKTPE